MQGSFLASQNAIFCTSIMKLSFAYIAVVAAFALLFVSPTQAAGRALDEMPGKNVLCCLRWVSGN